MKLICLLATFVCQDHSAAGQDIIREIGRQAGSRAQALQQQLFSMMNNLQRLEPWEEHYGYMIESLQKVYERNGWNSEPDTFALDLVAEVEAIPPSRVFERFDKFSQIVRERYSLDPEQEQALMGLIMRDGIGLISRHADRIGTYVGEVVETRAEGRAITAEQVARWAELTEPVLRDGIGQFNKSAGEFREKLRPEQREVLDRDLQAPERRVERVTELARDWARGNWEPGDWGIEDDPIQLAGEAEGRWGGESNRTGRKTDEPKPAGTGVEGGGAASASLEESGAQSDSGSESAGQPDARNEVMRPKNAARSPDVKDDWAQYVQSFIQRFNLDEPQQNRAWTIYREVSDRRAARRPAPARADGPAVPPASVQPENGAAGPKRLERDDAQPKRSAEADPLFEQLKRRLDRLPTRAQRRAAEDTALKGGSTTDAKRGR